MILLGKGVFVLLISNINGVSQNSLTAPSNVKLNYANCDKHINKKKNAYCIYYADLCIFGYI